MKSVCHTDFGWRGGGEQDKGRSGHEWLIYGLMVLLFSAKVLWGFWERDLTTGDTSSYFLDAVNWHQLGQVNIVWSPLYTAYYGLWLSVTDNAAAATLLHRVGLIFVSTGLVAWLGMITLPCILAFLLACWWVALPIHYDTLYEVHLFGSIPLLIMALISVGVKDRWRMPLLLGTSLVTAILIRNEYIIVLLVLGFLEGLRLFRNRSRLTGPALWAIGMRHAIALLTAGMLISLFYSLSYLKGPQLEAASGPKHTLNMCQVYAFGYQQRNPEWSHSPWTECAGLMQEMFGSPQPTLWEMMAANPGEVARHFLWNMSLTRAGLEVLLFNATSARDNPDYASVLRLPVLPAFLLGLTIIVCLGGLLRMYRKPQEPSEHARSLLARMGPLLPAAVLMSLAVILTQRPRPSYLLGQGVLMMWLAAVCFHGLLPAAWRGKINHLGVLVVFGILLLLIFPSYASLPLPSKAGSLGLLYETMLPHSQRLCTTRGPLALGDYDNNLASYLCGPQHKGPIRFHTNMINISSLPGDALSRPETFVAALEERGVQAIIVDPFMVWKYPGLEGCAPLQDAFLNHGWQQVAYSLQDDGRCLAAYVLETRSASGAAAENVRVNTKVVAFRQRFALADTDGDGGLSPEELARTGPFVFPEIKKNFSAMDTNADGAVSLQERAAFIRKRRMAP